VIFTSDFAAGAAVVSPAAVSAGAAVVAWLAQPASKVANRATIRTRDIHFFMFFMLPPSNFLFGIDRPGSVQDDCISGQVFDSDSGFTLDQQLVIGLAGEKQLVTGDQPVIGKYLYVRPVQE